VSFRCLDGSLKLVSVFYLTIRTLALVTRGQLTFRQTTTSLLPTPWLVESDNFHKIINFTRAVYEDCLFVLKSVIAILILYLQNVYVTINRILVVAQRLCDAGHYATPQIRALAVKLEREWQTLASALEDRNTVLAMSVIFHKKAEEVLMFTMP
jgi:hypothetical protein